MKIELKQVPISIEQSKQIWQANLKHKKSKAIIVNGEETRELEAPCFFRRGQIVLEREGEAAVDAETRLVELAFSSEDPYQREYWIGGEWIEADEVLDHSPDSVRMDWLKSGSAPLLKDHWRFEQVGVVLSAELDDDKVGRALVKFGKSSIANDEFLDVAEGVRQNVSVGYIVHKMALEVKDDKQVMRVLDWEPFEISMVSLPADRTVGVGKSDSNTPVIVQLSNSEGNTMTPEEKAAKEAEEKKQRDQQEKDRIKQAEKDAIEQDRNRMKEIRALGEKHNMSKFADEHIDKGTSIEAFRGLVLDKIGDETPLDQPPSQIGLSEKEAKSFSLLKLMRALANPTNKAFQEAAAFEFECSETVRSNLSDGKAPQGAYIPLDVRMVRTEQPNIENLMRAMETGLIQQRALSVGGATAGAELVGTDHLGSSFIEALRNALVSRGLGARVLSGLVGNVEIPKQVSGAGWAWLANEDDDAALSELVTGLVTLSMKTGGAYTEVTRSLLLQSDPSAEALVRDDLVFASAEGIDNAVFNGTGASGQPTGIRNTAGVGNVPMGTNGGSPDWAKMVEFVTNVLTSNALRGSLGWVINGQTWGTLMSTEKANNTAQFILSDSSDRLVSHRYEVTQQLLSNLTKGTGTNLSSAIFGNWNDVLIGEWGMMDLLVDPYTHSLKGKIRFVVHQSVDVAIRHPASFSISDDIITL